MEALVCLKRAPYRRGKNLWNKPYTVCAIMSYSSLYNILPTYWKTCVLDSFRTFSLLFYFMLITKAPLSKARSFQSHEDWDVGSGCRWRMDECHRFYVIVLSCVDSGLSDGPTPLSRRPTDCVKFLVTGLNYDIQRARGCWRERTILSNFCQVNPWNIVVEP